MTTSADLMYATPEFSGQVFKMPTNMHTASQWTPGSADERQLVLTELEAIVSSYHFRGSKRYPALLKYVVEATLDGRASDLKERTLGVEVFGRNPDYDTNADPVVRFSASEVRKRIAQYYHENEGSTRLQIELPLGSYAPEFLLRAGEAPEGMAAGKNGAAGPAERGNPGRRLRTWVAVASVVVLLVAAGLIAAYSHRQGAAAKVSITDKFWGPFAKSSQPILIVVGTSHPHKMVPDSADTSFGDYMVGPHHHVSVATATALANLVGVLRLHGITYEIKEDTEASLTDLHSRPLILVGATNNAWTMRLVNPLRFRFINGPMAKVQDAKDPESFAWGIDFSKPYTTVASDFAIVARFYDATTEGPVMVVAGLGPYGTEAASSFAVSPQYMEQIVQQMPTGWEDKNIELVIKSNVIDGKAGPPVLVGATGW